MCICINLNYLDLKTFDLVGPRNMVGISHKQSRKTCMWIKKEIHEQSPMTRLPLNHYYITIWTKTWLLVASINRLLFFKNEKLTFFVHDINGIEKVFKYFHFHKNKQKHAHWKVTHIKCTYINFLYNSFDIINSI